MESPPAPTGEAPSPGVVPTGEAPSPGAAVLSPPTPTSEAAPVPIGEAPSPGAAAAPAPTGEAPFLQPPATNPASPPPPPLPSAIGPVSPKGLSPGLIVGIGIGGLIVLVGVGIFVIFYRRRKERRLDLGNDPIQGPKARPSVPPPGNALSLSQSTFTYEELEIATDGFSNVNLLGQGGFGYVHKGMLSSGKVVAIKQLKAGSRQGEREFQAEVDIISRIHHRHLVSLVGYCISGAQRILVYEFVPNGTLEFHLHGKDRPTMAWPTRMKIALGFARGLAYLHEDYFNFEAKVADFGLAKIAFDTDTHVSTRVMGTFGYLAPEYASSGKLTNKSDVFSFGVVLLELITGRRPIDKSRPFVEDSMVDWARPLLAQALKDGIFDAVVDPKLHKDYATEEMTRMIACAAACVRHSAQHRPRMTQVVRALEGYLSPSDLNEGIVPGHSIAYSPHGSSDYDTSQYQEDLKKFRMMALESQEQATSEYSGLTSEYGLHPSSSSSGFQHTTQEMDLGKMAEDGRHANEGW
ncbi:hypothetical protein EUGRSUZ_J02973 [Eucalyptus grandis]|uniref:Uncharacterized protein n=2 Tax=Eucalyptus grandis TaxID=71139 RepID=A0ACC3JAD8_EUCGR|nr:hypothetical protein EUGRSUZ_J02973 [Eucalyptus grandis]